MAGWLETVGRRIKEGREKVNAGAASTGGSYSSGGQQRQAAEPSIGQTWELPDLNTTRGLLARFYQMGSTDPTRAQEGLTMFEQLRMDPSSVYFNPYASHTNRALDNLRELGMEVDEVNDDWFAANAGLKQYYKPTANTNSLSSTMTNRRASPEEKAAYYYNQLWMAEGTTKKAEQEWSALQKELTYRASQADRNYSDDEIIGMIDWKKYPTLAKMDETRKQGTPMELNRAIGYSQDALYGTLWAARNEGGTGNPYQDMINSALGVGNVYTEDETIRAKRTYSSEFYSPFSLGSTMDKEREHFGVDSFDQHWVDNHAYLMDTGSDDDKEYYINVVEALDETNTAMGEYDRLKAAVDRSIETAKTPEEAKERLHLLLDSGEFPKLKKMDATMKRGNDKLMKTTSAIPYSMGDMERYIDEQWGTVRANTQDEIGYAEELERQVSGPEIVISQDTEDHEVDAVTGADIPVNTPAPVEPTETTEEAGRQGASSEAKTPGRVGSSPIIASASPWGLGAPPSKPQDEQAETPAEEAQTPEAEAETAQTPEAPVPDVPNLDWRLTDQTKAVFADKNATLNTGRDMLQETGAMTEAEADYMDAAGSVTYEPLSESLVRLTGKQMRQTAYNMAQAAVPKIRQRHVGSVLGTLQTTYDYQRNEENLEALRFQESQLAGTVAGREYVGQEPPEAPEYTIRRDGRDYRVTLSLYGDSYQVESIDDITGGNDYGVTDRDEWFSLAGNAFEGTGPCPEIQEILQEANDKAKAIQEQNGPDAVPLTEEEQETVSRLQQIRAEIEGAESYQREHETEYNAATEQFGKDQEALRSARFFNTLFGLDSTELDKADAVAGYMTIFNDYDATIWSEHNPTDLYANAIASGEDRDEVLAAAKEGRDSEASELELARTVRQYIQDNGLQMPENYVANLDRHIAKLERDMEDYNYFTLRYNDDFEEVAAKGRQIEFDERDRAGSSASGFIPYYGDISEYYENSLNGEVNVELNPFDLYGLKGLTGGFNSLMTEDELNTYYYLLGSGDREGAEKYAAFMSDETYGVLNTRERRRQEDSARGLVNSGIEGFIAGNAMAAFMSPLSAISAISTYARHAMTGNELNPDNPALSAAHYRGAAREESAAAITRRYKEGTWQNALAQAGYEMITSRADSAVNMAVFGPLFSGMSEAGFWAKAAKEAGTAAFMGLSASMDAAMDAKTRGASDAQAYGIAGVTFMAETLTEAISLENIGDAFEIGKEVTGGTVKDFLKNWLTKAGVSESFGEALTDIIENQADEKIMGSLSNHKERVYQYRLEHPGASTEEAEEAARRAELGNVLRTALISYMTPGLDIGASVIGSANQLDYYRDLTRQHQEAGDNRSMLEIMRGTKRATRELTEAGAFLDGSVSQDKLVSSFEMLNSAENANKPSQTATVAAVLNGVTDKNGTVAKATADAAAVGLGKIFGRRSLLADMQELVTGGAVHKVDAGNLMQALQTGALSESSAARRVMTSSEFKRATPDERAAMLVQTVEADRMNRQVPVEMIRAVHENRVAAQTKVKIAEGGLDSAKPAVTRSRRASRAARVAESELQDRQDESQAAREAVKTAETELQRDPVGGAKQMQQALAKVGSTSAVEQEYTQSAEKAQEDEREAKTEAQTAVSSAMTAIREEAEADVAAMEQQEAQAEIEAQAAAEQQAILEQEEATRQDMQDNADQADMEDFISRQYADATPEEQEHIRELFRQAQEQARQTGNLDTDRQRFLVGTQENDVATTPTTSIEQDDTNRKKFLQKVANTYGLSGITEIDPGVQADAENAERLRKLGNANGYYDPDTNEIVLNKKATTEDKLFFVLGHELTHVTEAAGDYTALANSILQLTFGEGVTYQGVLDEMKNGLARSPLARMVAGKRSTYESFTGQSQDDAYYLQEIVADNMGILLRGDAANPGVQEDLVGRLVQENPSMARRIMESIKSFLKKAVGAKGAWQTDMQNTVDLFTRTLQKAQDVRLNGQQETVPEAKPMTDRQGRETAADQLRGGTAVIDTEKLSLNSFDEAEQARTRAALLAATDPDTGDKLYTPDQVDKYMDDALGIAAMIAADRGRLDFEANPAQKFLKSNNDYYYTLDASTLCAKRLLYQGTFDYVQHALPNEVFLPEDLIDLVNIMNEMGYETPCGICYVESRRRWLDKYANEFIESLPEENRPSLDQLTTSDGLERLRTEDPEMYQAFVDAMNAKGSANPKVVQLRTEYRGDIGELTERDIQKVKDIGGLRIQSFSDFETPHLLDMVQAVYDMAGKGLTSQAYTKVPNFAWVFGDTGIKINLSLIGKGTGLDDNGNLVFDNREGMNFDEAMRLRDRYSKNVGTILVGINDEHIIAAMGDPRIDFIIPFHKSGWSQEELRKMPTLNNYNDYTSSQNERLIVGERTNKVKTKKNLGQKAVDNWIAKEGENHPGYEVTQQEDGKFTILWKDGYQTESFQKHQERTKENLSNFEPVGANKYWEFDKSGEWNARKYLQMCADAGRIPKFSQFLVDNGDGSFSLPEGDDKRSTAIRTGYWKTLIDFKMYDNEGNGAEQKAVTPNINMDQAQRVLNEHKLGRQMPDQSDGTPGKFLPVASNNDVPVATLAGDEFIRRVLEKRRGGKPIPPNTPLEATPEINVMQGTRANFGDEGTTPATATIFGATEAPAVLGNTPSTYQEGGTQNQVRMAIDAETGETQRLSLGDIDSVFDDMSLEELSSLLGTESEEEVRNIQTNAVRDLKDEFDPTIYNGKLYVKPETLNHWLSGQGFASTDPNYAQAYITTMNPADFLRMTTATVAGQQAVLDSSHPLNDEELGRNAERQPIQLLIDESTGKITGHEGRHRAVALARAGVTEMPVLLFDSSTKYNKTAKDSMTLEGQNPYFMPDVENGNTLTFNDVIPLSQGNADIIRERFTASAEDEAAAAQNNQRVLRYSLPSDAAYIAAVERGEGDEAGLEYDLQESDGTETHYGDRTRFSLRVKDQDELDFLNNQETITTYKTMQLIDGHLYPPMAAIVAGNVEDYSVLGEWEKATEHPELIKNGNKFTLNKGKGKGSLYAAYNPYMHSSNLMINDQFSGAYNRPELVTVECEVPVSEDNGAYHAEFAKDSTGWHSWHTGTVAGQLRNQKNIERQVFLSRWIKPVRIIPDSEVAQHYAELLDGSDIAVPDNVVSPSLLAALKEAGVPIKESGRLPSSIRYQLPDDTVLIRQIQEYLAAGGSLSPRPAVQTDNPAPRQRQFGSLTAQRETAPLHDNVKDYLQHNSDYDPDSNRAQIDRSIRWINSFATDSDPEGYAGALDAVDSPDFDFRSADGQARMLALMSMAALKAEAGDARAHADELRLADAYNRQGTQLGQQLQARRIFQLMTPLGRQATIRKMEDKINEDYKKKGKSTQVHLSKDVLDAAGKAKNPKDFDNVRRQAAKELAAQMPANWKDKLTGWRMLAMLGNPRTHVRNILGNALFMPMVGIKNKIGAVVEIASRQETRSKTLGLANSEARAFAKADAKEMESVLRGDAKYKDGDLVQQEQKIFGQGKGIISKTVGKTLQALSDFNSKALEGEDWIFLSRHYRNALAGYMTANKLKASDMTGETLDSARAYAVQEAKKATYRDANAVAEWLNDATKKHPGLGFAVNAALPFKKTPANILKRGVEYSPVGLINALTRGAKQVRQWNAYQNKELSALPDKAISPQQFIDKISAGLTGTGIMVLGAILSNLGAATAGLGDDDDEFEKLKGNQEYSINPGKAFNRLTGIKLFGEDATYTIDWAAPASMPFFVGAALTDSYKGLENFNIVSLLDSLAGITEPVFNLSMLDGVNSLLDVSQYAEGNAFTQIGEKLLANYASSYVPSFLGAATRSGDTTRRKSYVESGADLSTFRYAWEGVENKLPWLSQTNIPYRDVWGNAEVSGQAEALIENFISPGYGNALKDDPVVTELERLYGSDSVPEDSRKAMVPKAAGKTINNVKLNAEQYDQYVVTRGQTAHDTLEALMESPYWQVCDDATRASMVKDAWTYANQIGQNAVTGRQPDKWIMAAQKNGSVVDSILSRAADSNRSSYITGYGQALAEAIDNDDREDIGTAMAALSGAEASYAEIREPLRSYFKPLYQAAYSRGDTAEMQDIRIKLIEAGVGFKSKDFNSWIPGLAEEEEFEGSDWLTNP